MSKFILVFLVNFWKFVVDKCNKNKKSYKIWSTKIIQEKIGFLPNFDLINRSIFHFQTLWMAQKIFPTWFWKNYNQISWVIYLVIQQELGCYSIWISLFNISNFLGILEPPPENFIVPSILKCFRLPLSLPLGTHS